MEDIFDFYIIDPSYVEFNRGGYGYLPYLTYIGLKEQGFKVGISEDFTMPQLDHLPKAKKYLIALWAYPQMDLAVLLNKFLDGEFWFFGYYPLIDQLKLPKFVIPNNLITIAMTAYPKYYKDFKFILLCDDDMHLKKYDGQVYPLFTSYGCGNGCAFCPLTVNCNYTRIEAPLKQVINSLFYCYDNGMDNIHFTDDDFFHNVDRAYEILSSVYDLGMNFIALATVTKIQKFIDKYGEEALIRSGVKIVEVGFETADEEVAALMHKPQKDKYVRLRESLKQTDIFWLTLTFFPGETINSLNKTGKFLSEYGFKMEDVYKRIATNSTEGGLGQFMQLYHGVKHYDELRNSGFFVNERPVRLMPSFIPFSFLKSKIKKINAWKPEYEKWFKLYRVNPFDYPLIENRTIQSLTNTIDGYIFYAICARLRIIE